MTVSLGPLANLGREVSDQTVGNVLRRRGIARLSQDSASAGAQAHDHVGRIHSGSPCGAGGYRLLHRGGSDDTGIGDLLRVVLYSS
jgi:hypothetical protein